MLNSPPSPPANARVLPPDLPLAEAALAGPVAVGMHCMVRSGIRPGAKVLILGAGPIGLTVAFWARRIGASKSSSPT